MFSGPKNISNSCEYRKTPKNNLKLPNAGHWTTYVKNRYDIQVQRPKNIKNTCGYRKTLKINLKLPIAGSWTTSDKNRYHIRVQRPKKHK